MEVFNICFFGLGHFHYSSLVEAIKVVSSPFVFVVVIPVVDTSAKGDFSYT